MVEYIVIKRRRLPCRAGRVQIAYGIRRTTMERIRIQDGIYLNIIKSDKFKTDYLDFNILLPLKKETASHAALLPMVLKRGCEKYPTMAQLNKKLDYLYSTSLSSRVLKRGEVQVVGFLCDFLRESLLPQGEKLMAEVFDIIRSVIFEPKAISSAFDSEFVESEKKNLCDAIDSLINNKNAYAIKKCHEAMCRGENFAVNELGDIESVKSITPGSLYGFYKELLRSARFEIFYTGLCDSETIKGYISDMVSSLERGSLYTLGTKKLVSKKEKPEEITEEMEVAQGKLIMGFCSDHTFYDSNYTAFSLFNELFGGSPTSKLFENVREKLSLCYYCRSIPEAHKGILTVASGIEVDNRDSAVNEILLQLENVKNGIISDEEMDSARKSLINAYRELYDDGTSLPLWYLSRIIAGNTKTIEDVIDELREITKKDIAECAKKVCLNTVYFLKGTLKSGGDEQ